jgi:hypothetical protein
VLSRLTHSGFSVKVSERETWWGSDYAVRLSHDRARSIQADDTY